MALPRRLLHAILLRTDDDFDEGDEFCLASWDYQQRDTAGAEASNGRIRDWKGFLHAANDVFRGLTGAGAATMHFDVGSSTRTAVFFPFASKTLLVLCFLGHLAEEDAKEEGNAVLDLLMALTGPAMFCCPALPQSSRDEARDEAVADKLEKQAALFRAALDAMSSILLTEFSLPSLVDQMNEEEDENERKERDAALAYVDRSVLRLLTGCHYRPAHKEAAATHAAADGGTSKENAGDAGDDDDDIPSKARAVRSSPLPPSRLVGSSADFDGGGAGEADGFGAARNKSAPPAIVTASALWLTTPGADGQPQQPSLLAFHGLESDAEILRLGLLAASAGAGEIGSFASQALSLPTEALAAVERVTAFLSPPTSSIGAAPPSALLAHVVPLHLPFIFAEAKVSPTALDGDFEVGTAASTRAMSSRQTQALSVPERCESADSFAAVSDASSFFSSMAIVVRIPLLRLAVTALVGPGTFPSPAGGKEAKKTAACACKMEKTIDWRGAAASTVESSNDLTSAGLPPAVAMTAVTDACAALLSHFSRARPSTSTRTSSSSSSSTSASSAAPTSR